jgi:hypothetical protein
MRARGGGGNNGPRGPWQFMPATCCRVTQDEVGLLTALAQARVADATALATSMRVLAGQDEAPRLTAALKAAAETLQRLGPSLAAASSLPPAMPTTLH